MLIVVDGLGLVKIGQVGLDDFWLVGWRGLGSGRTNRAYGY